MNTIVLAIVSIAGVIAVIALMLSANKHHRQRMAKLQRPEGTEAEYAALRSELALTVENAEQLAAAQATRQRLYDQDRQGGDPYSAVRPLSVQAYRYYRELGEAVSTFLERNPHLEYDANWHAARHAQITAIEQVVAQAKALVGQHSLKYAPAKRKLESAKQEAAAAKRLINGEYTRPEAGGCGQEMLNLDLEHCEHKLQKALATAQEALRLFTAESQSSIRYEHSVRDLLHMGAHTDDYAAAEAFLRQALAQAEAPDADKDPRDLTRALQGLALVLWRHRDNPAEAEQLYLRALSLYADNDTSDDVTETLNDLLRLYAGEGRLDEAERYFQLLQLRLMVHPVAHLDKLCSAHICLGDAYLKAGDVGKAEYWYRKALGLCDSYEGKRAYSFGHETRTVLKKFISFYCSQGRYKAAAKSYDQMVASERSDFERNTRSPDELRLYANMMQQVGRNGEAEELLEQATERQREYDRFRDEPVSNLFPMNCLHLRLEHRMLLEMF